jgi:hypothetical protein
MSKDNLFSTVLNTKCLEQRLKGTRFLQKILEPVSEENLFPTMPYRKCFSQCLRGICVLQCNILLTPFLPCSAQKYFNLRSIEFILYHVLQQIFEPTC